jgi:uncharacterized protein YbjT (DUF2867 family)
VRVLVIGATGYVGSRLVPRLLAEGHAARCLARDPARLDAAEGAGDVEVVRGDATDPTAVRTAAGGVDAAVHLVHSLEHPDFAARDRRAAEVLAAAAADAGVGRIVYLSGLQPPAGAGSSAHLASRREVGELFLAGPVPAAVLQAGIVVGSGSASFDLIGRLAHAASGLPVAFVPDRAWNRVQPIAVGDLLHYITAALLLPVSVNRTFDVGGPDVLTYQELTAGYARVAGLRTPLAVPVPVAAPRLTARLLEALTPFDRHLVGPLLASTAHDLICREDDLDVRVGPPPGGRTPYAEAVAHALRGTEDGVSSGRPRSAPACG